MSQSPHSAATLKAAPPAEHHGQEGEHAPTRLQVRTVPEVHCRYEVPSGSTSNVRHPVPGTTELVPVREADGWARTRPQVSFTGYLATAARTQDGQGSSASRNQ
ncbi:DUF6578 domain-containing protein [Streptomyces chartreusis]